MKDHPSSLPSQIGTTETETSCYETGGPETNRSDALSGRSIGVSFDHSTSLSSLKRLQDPAKFNKARFRFRLYRK